MTDIHSDDDDREIVRRLEVAWAVDPSESARAEARDRAIARLGRASGRRRRWVPWVAATAVTVLVAAVLTSIPGALPGDPGYPVKRGWESLRLGLAGDIRAETRGWLQVAQSRLAETVRAQGEGRTEALQVLLDDYVVAVAEVEDRLGTVEDPALSDQVGRELLTHERVLSSLLEVVPEPARPGLQRALDASRRAHGGPPDAPPGLDRAPPHGPDR
ncbi:MAG: DUF5667 domain-containing protein [Jiangellaceae bacterium]